LNWPSPLPSSQPRSVPSPPTTMKGAGSATANDGRAPHAALSTLTTKNADPATAWGPQQRLRRPPPPLGSATRTARSARRWRREQGPTISDGYERASAPEKYSVHASLQPPHRLRLHHHEHADSIRIPSQVHRQNVAVARNAYNAARVVYAAHPEHERGFFGGDTRALAERK
jgi:hypothetical protein